MTTLLYHIKKMKNMDLKKCQSSFKIKNINKTPSNEELLMNCIETFLICIFLIFKKIKWHNCHKFYPR